MPVPGAWEDNSEGRLVSYDAIRSKATTIFNQPKPTPPPKATTTTPAAPTLHLP
jgi:hypothetical protein